MHPRTLLAACMLAALPACMHVAATAELGYGRFALDGNFGYVSGSSTSVSQDVKSAFGLGDERDVPYARGELELGNSVITLSGFSFEESGTGTLQQNFGNSPVLIAGTPVRSEFELWNVKASYAFEIPIVPGIASVAPGIAVDYIDLNLRVQDVIGIATEEAHLDAPIPLLFVRAKGALGPVSAVADVGYMKLRVDQVDLELLDAEARLEVRPLPLVHLFLGYRLLALNGSGRVDNNFVDADLSLGGFVIGGGVTF
jgi:hypothetical protein